MTSLPLCSPSTAGSGHSLPHGLPRVGPSLPGREHSVCKAQQCPAGLRVGSGRERRAGGLPQETDRCGGPHCSPPPRPLSWTAGHRAVGGGGGARGRLGQRVSCPERQEGHLLKKRKWPLKGWHKVGWQGRGRGQMPGPEGMWAPGQHRLSVCEERLPVWLLCSTPFPLRTPHPGPCSFWAPSQRYLCLRMDSSLRDNSARCELGPRLWVWREGGPGQAGGFWNPRARPKSQVCRFRMWGLVISVQLLTPKVE